MTSYPKIFQKKIWFLSFAVTTVILLILQLCAGCVSVPGYRRGATSDFNQHSLGELDMMGEIRGFLQANDPDRALFTLEFSRSQPYFARQVARQKEAILITPYQTLDYQTVVVEDFLPVIQDFSKKDMKIYWNEYQKSEEELRGFERNTNYIERPFRRLFAGKTVVTSSRDIRLSLGPNEILLEYFEDNETIYLIVVTTREVKQYRIAIPAADIHRRIQDLRVAITSQKDWQTEAAELFTLLLKPAGADLSQAETIFVVQSKSLLSLPFVLLEATGKSGQQLNLEKNWVYLPSFTLYRFSQSRSLANTNLRFLGIVNDSKRLASLRPLSRIYPDSALITGEASPIPSIIELFPAYSLLHLEGRVVTSDIIPLASGIELNPSGRTDGFLTAAEIMEADLGHIHAVFINERGGDDHLIASFIMAGAPTVITSLWEPPLDSKKIFLSRYYERIPTMGPAQAVWVTQKEMAAQSSTAHPIYWAGYIVCGFEK